MTRLSQTYFRGDELLHHAGDVWRVVAANLDGDGQFHEGMLALAGDYRIVCVRGRELGNVRRVHADYLHGDGWVRVPNGAL